ncbi:gliding motility-associated ABC transporter substrate-binding protein GldG [uncultured Sunxiuqinia sp.]|uniref:gliding motility-associated ABC transporter substrate-binding protein GldG n=1 Tax=uncultured Sunxiuqinia sp. TaxID=1573825 RepID=UPI0026329DC8|nr:gliding motility-associated ABC transporter substrate-binding protein GldG [uncultured Sunxiuqinia sp.]
MYSLFRKEITTFFGSLTGYLVAFVFLIANGLFLWVFPGNYNLLDNGYATLDGYFSLAPWIFLFLVPALTMRLLAEEKRSGTLEILVTRPISLLQLVWAKYLAGLVLVLLCLLPTLVYFYTVYQLGNPAGNWDAGASWGAFIGLFCLAAGYVAIGLAASATTDNPVLAFMLALFVSFLTYQGFELAAGLNFSPAIREMLIQLGINEHYLSVSRGVVDSRDLIYFLSLSFFFLVVTSLLLQQKQKKRNQQLKKLAILMGGLLVMNLVAGAWFFRLDLTSEKRYSLSPVSKQLIQQLDAPIKVDIFLDGELPPGFRKLQQALVEKIQDINAYADYRVHYELLDPYKLVSTTEEQNKLFDRLVSLGLRPTDLRLQRDEGTVTKLIFPGAVIKYKDYDIGINLLKNNPSLSPETNLNQSVETLEYELMRAFNVLLTDNKPTVAFLQGQDELTEPETRDIRQTLTENFQVTDMRAEALFQAESLPDVLVIADPKQAFSEQDKFYIDQYLMRGGNLLWLIDPVRVSLDSLSRGETTLAFSRDLNLNDQLFRYGVRVNPNLVQDVECLMIPVNTAPVGSPPKYTPAPWYYSPLLKASQAHVLSRNLNQLKAEFVSTIDTVGKDPAIRKSVVLHTSNYSRKIQTPLEVSLQSINQPPSQSMFNEKYLMAGVLLEGQFPSVFQNRMLTDFNTQKIEVMDRSKPARMIVIADGSLIANQVSRRNGQVQILPLGYDRYSQQTFGNKEFLVHAISYLCDKTGLMFLRSQAFQIRLLDKVKIREQRLFWQLFNVLIPLALISVLGLIFSVIRRRKYSG